MSGDEAACAEAFRAVDLGGGLHDAERLRKLAVIFGATSVPFLRSALGGGSVALRAMAIEQLGALAPGSVTELADALLVNREQPVELREAAARALAHVPTLAALDTLLLALGDRPLVRSAAWDSIQSHASPLATDHLAAIVRASLGEPTAARRPRVSQREPGGGRFLSIVAARRFVEFERELVGWWQTHSVPSVQHVAAWALLRGNPAHARAILREGLPGANEGVATSPGGELDNGQVRHLLVGTIVEILRGDPADAFQVLAPYLALPSASGWFETKRAELIVLLLLGKVGVTYDSTWLSVAFEEVPKSGQKPDPRWRKFLAGLEPVHPALRRYVTDLSAALRE